MTQIVCGSERIGLGWVYGPHQVLGEIPDRCPECGMQLFGAPQMQFIHSNDTATPGTRH